MADQNMEQRIRDAVNHATPDVFDKIYASCEEQKGKVIHMDNNNNLKSNKYTNKRRWYAPVAVAAAAVLLVGIGGFGYNSWNQSNTVNSVVMLDVNPSISLNVNGKERVISVEPRNEEGVKILGDMDLKNTDLEVAVNALIGSMLQNGYLTDLQNAILVSVEDDDANRGNDLQSKLSNMIEQILNNGQFESAVFSQRVTADASIKELAERYDISEGKAALIKELAQQDNTITVESLASLSVQEIGLIMESKGITTKEVSQVGHASEKAYIGKEEAKKVAYTHADIAENDVTNVEIEFDTEDGVMVYEIEFDTKDVEYEYVIDAKVGTILQFEKEPQDNSKGNNGTNINQTSTTQPSTTQTPSSNTAATNYISKEKVKEIALDYSKVTETQVTVYELDLDDDDNRMVYDVEFETKDAEYDLIIDALTGKVLDYEIDYKDNSNQTSTSQDDRENGSLEKSNGSTNTSSVEISKEKAKEIALAHAKVNASSVTKYEVELDREGSITKYEIDFETKSTEYEYEIDGKTGTVLNYESEPKDNVKTSTTITKAPTVTPTKAPTFYVSKADAKAAAIAHAKVDESQIKEYEIELDENDDDTKRAVYEIQFKQGNKEYEYEIDAITGNVIKSEINTEDEN